MVRPALVAAGIALLRGSSILPAQVTGDNNRLDTRKIQNWIDHTVRRFLREM